MLDPALLPAFMLATLVLLLIPGPNVALIVANSVAYGARYGLLTVAGTSAAMVVQLGLTGLGMAELLGAAGQWFGWVRWLGVAYLLFAGVRQWRAPVADLASVQAQPRSAAAILLRALLVSLTNPKTLLFYGAFLPQFVVPWRRRWPPLPWYSWSWRCWWTAAGPSPLAGHAHCWPGTAGCGTGWQAGCWSGPGLAWQLRGPHSSTCLIPAGPARRRNPSVKSGVGRANAAWLAMQPGAVLDGALIRWRPTARKPSSTPRATSCAASA